MCVWCGVVGKQEFGIQKRGGEHRRSGVENRVGGEHRSEEWRTEEERTRNEEAETPTVHVYTVFSNSTVFCGVCGGGDVKRRK